MVSDRDAILACQAGDTQMYKHLVERYKQRAFYTALLYTRNRDDALDLSQEAFYRAFRAINRFDVGMNFYTWFYKILKNLCINFVTRKKNHGSYSDEYYQAGMAGEHPLNPEEIFEKNETSEMLWSALKRLKEKDREIIILKEFNEMSYQEIAEVLDIPIGSVMSRLYYARQRLLKEVESLNAEI